ncbi:MAG: hypothetical protein Q8O22_08075 [Candidatus Omnitrophota bacterium]|nr:hypothetical protein [Candidatus Omnitrophota bacterium]
MKKKLGFIGLMLIVSMITSSAAAAGKPGSGANPAEIFMDLRSQIFNMSPGSAGITVESETEPWGIVMDIGLKKSAVTLVSLKDGTASLYFSSGGVIIGGGENKSIHDFARDFVISSENFIPLMQRTLNYPLPEAGVVNIYILTGSGIFSSGMIREEDLSNGMDKFSKLFNSGQEVISALRQLDSRK